MKLRTGKTIYSEEEIDFKGEYCVYLPTVSSITFEKESGLFWFVEHCDEWYSGEMDAEAFQKYINQCQELLNESINLRLGEIE